MSDEDAEADDEIEKFAESLRTLDDHQLTSELSKLYHYLKSLGPNEDQKVLNLEIVKRKIGALEEEIGRRKKDGAWIWQT